MHQSSAHKASCNLLIYLCRPTSVFANIQRSIIQLEGNTRRDKIQRVRNKVICIISLRVQLYMNREWANLISWILILYHEAWYQKCVNTQINSHNSLVPWCKHFWECCTLTDPDSGRFWYDIINVDFVCWNYITLHSYLGPTKLVTINRALSNEQLPVT